MIIGLDNITTGDSTTNKTPGAIRHSLFDFLKILTNNLPQHQFKLFTAQKKDLIYNSKNLQIIYCSKIPKNKFFRVIWEQFFLPYLIYREKIDVWFGITNHLPLLSSVPSIVTARTLQVFSLPDSYSFFQRIYQKIFTPLSFYKAKFIIAFSRNSKEEIISKFKINASKIKIAYHFVPLDVKKNNPAALKLLKNKIGDNPFILSVSSFYPYKNLFRLIKAFAKIKNKANHFLVFVGAETFAIKQKDLIDLAKKFKVAKRIIFLGRIPHDQVWLLYKKADLFVMPSLAETFGYPILEAMASGCPTLTSNLSSMEEIAGDAGVLVNPYKTEEIAQGMLSIIKNEKLKKQLKIKSKKRAEFFKPEIHVRPIIKIFEKMEQVKK